MSDNPPPIDPADVLPLPDLRSAKVLPFARPDQAAVLKKATLDYLDGLRARVESGEVVGVFVVEDKGRNWTNAIYVRSYLELVAMLEVSKAEVVQSQFLVRDGDR
jgi:hypothetical protein